MSASWQEIRHRFEARCRKHVLLVAAITAWLIVFVVLVVFLWPTSRSGRTTYVTTLAQVLGGSALLVGLYFTYRTVSASQATLNLSIEKQDLDRRTHELTRIGQVADRFTKSLEQLGSPSEGVRIGALYALERLAKDRDDYYQQVIEVICSFIRRRSRDEDNKISADKIEAGQFRWASLDIETAMAILQRRRKCLGDGESKELNLRGANLSRLTLEAGDFDNADFSYAFMLETVSYGTNFAGAVFNDAHVQGSAFINAILMNAVFIDANVSNATFLFDRAVPDPSYRIAVMKNPDVGPPHERQFERPTARIGGDTVEGGRLLDGSYWRNATMNGAEFDTTENRFGHQGQTSNAEHHLNLSGMKNLTLAQYNSFSKPDDALPPTLLDSNEGKDAPNDRESPSS